MKCIKCGKEDKLIACRGLMQPRGMLTSYQIVCKNCDTHWVENSWNLKKGKEYDEQEVIWENVKIVSREQISDQHKKMIDDYQKEHFMEIAKSIGVGND